MDICQSCGMPLQKEADLGTNEDGSKNLEYCRFCFQKGRFTDEDITMDEKIEKNIEIAVSMGMAEETARKMATTTIPHLKRWKK
jgi:hypothetical protein